MTLPTHQQQHIETWQASGLSRVVYCHQHKLNSKTFSSWLKVHRPQQMASSTPTLLPIEIKSNASPSGSLCLRSPQGYILELPLDVSPQWLGGLPKCLN